MNNLFQLLPFVKPYWKKSVVSLFLREADNVVVIQNGEIAEQGNHQQLMDQRDAYYQLTMSQFKGEAI